MKKIVDQLIHYLLNNTDTIKAFRRDAALLSKDDFTELHAPVIRTYAQRYGQSISRETSRLAASKLWGYFRQ